MAILPDMSAELAQLKAMVAAQNAQIEALKAAKTMNGRPVTFKVSEKGAVSIYGLGQWPITLYASQWAKLEPMLPALAKFFLDNASKLSSKPSKDLQS